MVPYTWEEANCWNGQVAFFGGKKVAQGDDPARDRHCIHYSHLDELLERHRERLFLDPRHSRAWWSRLRCVEGSPKVCISFPIIEQLHSSLSSTHAGNTEANRNSSCLRGLQSSDRRQIAKQKIMLVDEGSDRRTKTLLALRKPRGFQMPQVLVFFLPEDVLRASQVSFLSLLSSSCPPQLVIILHLSLRFWSWASPLLRYVYTAVHIASVFPWLFLTMSTQLWLFYTPPVKDS